MNRRSTILLALFAIALGAAAGQDESRQPAGVSAPLPRPDLVGRVLSAHTGEPLAGAHVYIYTAAVRKGTSPFCPSCYVDCGKSATTDAEGRFAIESLDPDLHCCGLVWCIQKITVRLIPMHHLCEAGQPHERDPDMWVPGLFLNVEPILVHVVHPGRKL